MVANRIDYVLRKCRGQRVVHIGCADWPYTQKRIETGSLLHDAIVKVARYAEGVDLSQEGIALLQKFRPSYNLVCGDASKYFPNFEPDLVVCAETIEHVDCPGALLRSIRQWCGDSTKLLITTPNAYSFKGSLRALMGREFCHPDHVLVFSADTLRNLMRRTGWAVENVTYYFAPTKRWPNSFLAKLVELWCTVLASPRAADGLIVTARPVKDDKMREEGRGI